jgi:hypothetical protein
LIFYNADFDIFNELIKLRSKIILIIISSDIDFLAKAKLYYNVVTLQEDPEQKLRLSLNSMVINL